MKKILFIVNNGKISLNENGGSAVYYSHLELLYKLGCTIHLLVVQWNESDSYKEDDYAEVNFMVSSITSYLSVSKAPSKGFNRLKDAILYPHRFEYYFLNNINNEYLKNLVKEKQIAYVWAEWRWAGLWACFSKLNIPVIYAHHDWEFKLAQLRKKRNFLEQFHTFQKKRVELNLVKNADACVSGSYTEAQEIVKFAKKEALYIPTTYESIEPILFPNDFPNIVHLGGMGTTANRIGLERFIDMCWYKIKESNPNVKLLVVGSIKQATKTLKEKLRDPRIICKGFVEDLQTVLHPKDIHIIPWEYNTGTRTRVPVIFNYKQVLVAIKDSVAAFPEIKNDENSVLCDNLDDMSEQIITLLKDEKRIENLSNSGKQLFFDRFTSESHLNKLKEFLENIR